MVVMMTLNQMWPWLYWSHTPKQTGMGIRGGKNSTNPTKTFFRKLCFRPIRFWKWIFLPNKSSCLLLKIAWDPKIIWKKNSVKVHWTLFYKLTPDKASLDSRTMISNNLVEVSLAIVYTIYINAKPCDFWQIINFKCNTTN